MEPTSNAQKCKKYRDKTKQNYKKNGALHKKRYRLMMKLNDSEKYKEMKEKDKLRKRAERKQKRWSWRHYKHLQPLFKQQ